MLGAQNSGEDEDGGKGALKEMKRKWVESVEEERKRAKGMCLSFDLIFFPIHSQRRFKREQTHLRLRRR